ncbi:MAG: hypothetical protein FWC92_03070 [Defluviitaleaceae bacterium]|nr:hypothetical protein [Defluviitaleaceae bacterium]
MQTDEACRLRKEWGDKPCSHPNTEREYFLGASTGDFVCTSCGESFNNHELQRVRKLNIEKNESQ